MVVAFTSSEFLLPKLIKKELSKRNQEIRELKSEISKNKQAIIDEVQTSDNRLYSSFIY